jgi:hypothetical protein
LFNDRLLLGLKGTMSEAELHDRHRLRYVVVGVPRLQGHAPRFYAMIGEDAALDHVSRHLMRLTVAGQRKRRTDKAMRRAWHWLLAHEPPQHPGAANLATMNFDRRTKREKEWARWQAEAVAVRGRNPGLSVWAIAGRVKKNLELVQSPRIIFERIKNSLKDA